MNGRFLDGPRAGSRLHSSPGGTMPTPGYVGLEVRTLPLSNLVCLVEPVLGRRACERPCGGW